MPKITVYTSAYCPYCTWAKKLLDEKQATYSEVRVDQDREQMNFMVEKAGRTSVPQIFIGEQHIGGFDDLSALDRVGGLDPLLAAE